VAFVGELPQNPLTITIYPGPDRQYQLYLDDGISTQAEAGTYRTTKVCHQTTPGRRTVRIQRLLDAYSPPDTSMVVALLGTSRPNGGSIDGVALPLFNDRTSFDAALEQSLVY